MKRKMISLFLAALLCFSLMAGVSAASEADIYDEADLLSSTEEAQLAEKLSDIRETSDVQVVIMTIPSTDDDMDTFVEAVFDRMDMGCGENRDGVLLLVSMDPREYRILSNGFAGDAIESYEIEAIGEAIVSDLSDGNYASAFGTFADRCEYYLNGHLNGFPFNFGKNLLIALVVGIVAGLIVAFVLKGQLKSVRKQNQANVYVKPGSMQITTRNDFFLYRDVTRTEKTSSKSSDSGSSRNVGGGSF